jgi:hypothetical protein
MSSVIGGGNATSAVPSGTSGTSSVDSGVAPGDTTATCVVATTAGAWITPIVGWTDEFDEFGVTGDRSSSSDCENPYPTSSAATMTPTVTAISVVRDRVFGSVSVVSSTPATLSR